MPQTAEELEAQARAEQQRVDQKVEEAAQTAQKEAQAQGLSEDEVKKRVESARKEEKDKLYPQLEALKESMKEIQETLRQEREEKERIQQDAKAREDEQRRASLSSEDRLTEALTKLEEKLSQEQEQREKLQSEIKQSQVEARLATYRAQVIEAANGEIIPDLVRGQSETEIDRAADIAKARYTELVEQVKAKNDPRNVTRRATSPNTEALEEEALTETLQTVDQARYRNDPEYRDKIKNELAGAYARANGNA